MEKLWFYISTATTKGILPPNHTEVGTFFNFATVFLVKSHGVNLDSANLTSFSDKPKTTQEILTPNLEERKWLSKMKIV